MKKAGIRKKKCLRPDCLITLTNVEDGRGECYGFAVFLTKSRCKEFGVPIHSNGREKPCAFRYAAAAGTGTGDNKHRYFPLYDRTSVFQSGELSMDKLYKHEIMGKCDTTK